MVQPLWKMFWQFLIKLNILLPYDPAIMLFGIYPKELKTYAHTKTCTWMFTAELLTIGITWKQPKCLLLYEWMKKMWEIYTRKYF